MSTQPRLYGGVTIPGKPDMANLSTLDRLPVPMLQRMERYGIALDVPGCHNLTHRLDTEMNQLRADIVYEIPPEHLDHFIALADDLDDWCPINLESGDQLSELLFNTLKIGRGKELKKTKSGDRLSTGKKQMEFLKNDHPIIALILRYRERSKLKSTYTSALPKLAKFHPKGPCCPVCELPHVESTWRVHTTFTTTRTNTGRLASKAPNLQNIPARTELGRSVRALFMASPGCQLVTRDYSQIELRLLAHCSQDPTMIGIFLRNGDIHIETACEAFSLDSAIYYQLNKLAKTKSLTPQQAVEWADFCLTKRAPCKNLNFGIVYGLTSLGLLDHIVLTYATAGVPLPSYITELWCAKFIERWFGVYTRVHPYMDTQTYHARRYGLVWDELGRIRRVPEVSSAHEWIRQAGLRQAGNFPIQSLAAGVMKIGMGMAEDTVLNPLYQSGIWCWPLLPVHDELIIEVQEDYADYVGAEIGSCFANSFTDQVTGTNMCRVPIMSDGKTNKRWVKD